MILPKFIDDSIVGFLNHRGYILAHHNRMWWTLERRKQILVSMGIDLVIDVGANRGQYGLLMRKIGYEGRLVSFEPMSDAYVLLKALAEEDGNWDTHQIGLGDKAEKVALHVSENSVSSSVLDMLPLHRTSAPHSVFISEETVSVNTLDYFFDEIVENEKHIWLKLDVQGFEDRVLRGAHASLPLVEFIQIELSTALLYEGQSTCVELMDYLYKLGYMLVGLEPGFTNNETGELLQFDGIFHRL